MNISTKGRYGLRCMLDLAINSVNEHISLKSIAQRQDISESYLEQIFSSLRKAGFVKSVKGMQGGYVLSDNPSKYTVGQILRVLEGNLSVVGGSVTNSEGRESLEDIIMAKVWEKIDESINSVAESITLEDLVIESKTAEKGNLMYYI
jgi:Rrf2 family cysteine metabolism transcriptional repressor